MINLAGKDVGEYRLDCKLGQGPVGAVDVGRHEFAGPRVGVKVFDPALQFAGGGAPVGSEMACCMAARIQADIRHADMAELVTQ